MYIIISTNLLASRACGKCKKVASAQCWGPAIRFHESLAFRWPKDMTSHVEMPLEASFCQNVLRGGPGNLLLPSYSLMPTYFNPTLAYFGKPTLTLL